MQGAETGHIGPYELRGELGRGAMARVWRAWDPSLEREVAIKEPLVDPRLPEATIQEMTLMTLPQMATGISARPVSGGIAPCFCF